VSHVALSCAYLFRCFETFDLWFIGRGGCVGGVTAAFYGWLPLYLPELFPTPGSRAPGQGLSFNFGRILAAIFTLQTGTLCRSSSAATTAKRWLPSR